jgi:hypothetical protein
MAGQRCGRMDLKSAISRICAKMLEAGNKMQENSRAMEKKSLSSSFAVGTWNMGYDIDRFLMPKNGDANHQNDSDTR